MPAVPPLLATALLPVPDLATQPARVQQLIALILRHAGEICAYETGTVELHFHQGSVKGKLVQAWPTT